MGGKVIYDKNGEIVTRYETDLDGNFMVQSFQDCDELIKRCAHERAQDTLRGHRKTGTFHCVAELPVVLVEKLKAQGIDIINDTFARHRVLNSREFAVFRCSNGRV